MKKKIPIGTERFAEFSQEDFYYVDKTMFIAELLRKRGQVNLFTRPRRFGKSLNMNMLKTFFEIGCDASLFDGTKILLEKELCEQHMGKYPVISITLKDAAGPGYPSACAAMRYIIGDEASRFYFLRNSEKLTEDDKNKFRALTKVTEEGVFAMSGDAMQASLRTLSQLLEKHYGQKVILLIDEYDVPLDKAFQNGYYNEMVSLIRSLLGNVLKTNDSLYFAVLTGCLRISKESIFTGLNNLNVMTITDSSFNDCFGFTEGEVREILAYYELEDAFETVRDWYDGYCFGGVSVYCPWDVMKKEYLLAIPNNEIRNLFVSQIQVWFKETSRTDPGKLERFCSAFLRGDAENIERELKGYLWNSISIRDVVVRNPLKENFYHGMLLGLLQYETEWEIQSNMESGEGYCDIVIETPGQTGVLIELKYADDGNLEKECANALAQIREKNYDAALHKDGMEKIFRYGIAFYKKNCRVRSERRMLYEQ